jgi:HEAT repeat protein
VADALDALKDQQRRQPAAEYLATVPVDAARQAEVARALEPVLEDQQTFVRLAAAKALKSWADKDSVPALIKNLDQKFAPFSGDIQGNLMAALGRLADPRGAEAVAPYLANAFVNEDARRSLKAMGPMAEKEVVKYYFHPDLGAQQRARDLLQGYGTKPGVIARQAALELKSDDAQRRRKAVEWLAQTNQADADSKADVARGLVPVLEGTDPFLRDQAAKALALWATPETVPALIKALESQSGTVRQSALQALGKLKDERAVVPVAQRLLDFFDRKFAAEALINFGPKAERAVLTGLNNPDRAIRVEVCKILGVIGTNNSLKPLAQAAAVAQRKGEADVLQAALLAVQSIKDRLKAPMP